MCLAVIMSAKTTAKSFFIFNEWWLFLFFSLPFFQFYFFQFGNNNMTRNVLIKSNNADVDFSHLHYFCYTVILIYKIIILLSILFSMKWTAKNFFLVFITKILQANSTIIFTVNSLPTFSCILLYANISGGARESNALVILLLHIDDHHS